MCPWKEYREKAAHRGVMRPEIWEAVRPHLPEVQSVDFTGGGEPLLQPRLAEWIQDAKSAGCETGILTNGVLLNKETAEKLIGAGLDWVCVSIDGADKEQYERIRIGADFERVCENVGHLAMLRTGLRPRIMINFVMMSSNFHQVEDISRLAAHLGVDQVNFKQCEVIRGEHGKGHGIFGSRETRELRRLQKALARARSLARRLHVHTTASSFTPSERPVCEQDPRDSLFIRYDGELSPCISLAYGGPTTFLGREVIMPHLSYGRLPDRDLLELWETDSCKIYRERFEERARAYEDTFMAGLIGDSYFTPQKLLEAARRRMPDAPETCKICHYLYGI